MRFSASDATRASMRTVEAKPKGAQNGRLPPVKYPWDVRLAMFVRTGLLRRMLWRMAAVSVIGLYLRFRVFLATVCSGRVDEETYRERMDICGSCEAKEEYNGRWYCGACGCPRWRLSRLDIKNRFRGHLCPLRRHPGDYPSDWRFGRMGCGRPPVAATERQGGPTDLDGRGGRP